MILRIDISHVIEKISIRHTHQYASEFVGVPLSTWISWGRVGAGHRTFPLTHLHYAASPQRCCKIASLLNLNCQDFRIFLLTPWLKRSYHVHYGEDPVYADSLDQALKLMTQDDVQNAGQDAGQEDALDLLLEDDGIIP